MSPSARAPLNGRLGPRESIKSDSPKTLGKTLRVIADGLVRNAEELPRESDAGRLLREAATNLLDADTALEREAQA